MGPSSTKSPTNAVERSIRPIAPGRKNSLLAGSDGGARHWAIVASLINTAKLHAVEPFAWLKDALERVHWTAQCPPARRPDALAVEGKRTRQPVTAVMSARRLLKPPNYQKYNCFCRQ